MKAKDATVLSGAVSSGPRRSTRRQVAQLLLTTVWQWWRRTSREQHRHTEMGTGRRGACGLWTYLTTVSRRPPTSAFSVSFLIWATLTQALLLGVFFTSLLSSPKGLELLPSDLLTSSWRAGIRRWSRTPDTVLGPFHWFPVHPVSRSLSQAPIPGPTEHHTISALMSQGRFLSLEQPSQPSCYSK